MDCQKAVQTYSPIKIIIHNLNWASFDATGSPVYESCGIRLSSIRIRD
jgi:hypothetical protein